jgi:hypothetical protein
MWLSALNVQSSHGFWVWPCAHSLRPWLANASSIVGSTLRRCNWRKPKPVAKSFLPRFKRCGDHLNDRRRVDDGGPMTVDRTRSAVQRLHMRSAVVRLPSPCRPRSEVKQGEVVGITRASLSVARASRSLPH